MMKIVFIGLCLQMIYVSARNGNNFPNPYPELDRPLVEPLCPRGFKVSIPNIKGMQLFGFHGNVNANIANKEGEYSGDIRSPSRNGRWEYTSDEPLLRNGDIINYWIVAQIDQDSFRVENLRHIVKDYQSCEPYNKYRIPTILPLSNQAVPIKYPETSTPSCPSHSDDFALIMRQLNTTLMQLDSLNVIVNPLRQQVESLTELLQELIKDSDIGTKLLLVGQVPGSNANPVESVRDLITDRLQLFDLNTKILQAEHTPKGILFEMSSPIDKKRILFRASKLLKTSNYKIVDPESYRYDQERDGNSNRNGRTMLRKVD